MSEDVDTRLTELEVQLAHVQRLYDQLNEVVTEQTLHADRMERRLGQLQEQLKALKEKADSQVQRIDPLDEKPPHY